jgi:hypothetical protein
MDIGELVIWQGRRYRLRGFDPMSMPSRLAHLEDEETGEQVAVPAAELEPAGPQGAPG